MSTPGRMGRDADAMTESELFRLTGILGLIETMPPGREHTSVPCDDLRLILRYIRAQKKREALTTQPPPAPAGVAADAEQDRSDVWRTLGIPQDANADAAIAAIVALRRERDEARYCAVLETQRLDWLASRGSVVVRCHGEGLYSVDADNRSQVRSATGLRAAIDAASAARAPDTP